MHDGGCQLTPLHAMTSSTAAQPSTGSSCNHYTRPGHGAVEICLFNEVCDVVPTRRMALDLAWNSTLRQLQLMAIWIRQLQGPRRPDEGRLILQLDDPRRDQPPT